MTSRGHFSGDLFRKYEEELRDQRYEISNSFVSIGDISMRFAPTETREQQELKKAINSLSPALEKQITELYKKAEPLLESPIERYLLPWLIVQEYTHFKGGRRYVLLPGEGNLLPERRIAIVPQFPIGKYRADFAIAARRGGKTKFIIVECDGSEFHKDIARDAWRDVDILKYPQVLAICRISGKRIFKNPAAAAALVESVIADVWSVKWSGQNDYIFW